MRRVSTDLKPMVGSSNWETWRRQLGTGIVPGSGPLFALLRSPLGEMTKIFTNHSKNRLFGPELIYIPREDHGPVEVVMWVGHINAKGMQKKYCQI